MNLGTYKSQNFDPALIPARIIWRGLSDADYLTSLPPAINVRMQQTASEKFVTGWAIEFFFANIIFLIRFSKNNWIKVSDVTIFKTILVISKFLTQHRLLHSGFLAGDWLFLYFSINYRKRNEIPFLTTKKREDNAQ